MSADHSELCVQRERWEGAGAKLLYKDDGTVYQHSVYVAHGGVITVWPFSRPKPLSRQAERL